MALSLSRRIHLPQKLLAAILLLLLLGGLLLICFASVRRLFLELERLLERLLREDGTLSAVLDGETDYYGVLTSGIGLLERIGAAERFSAFREQFNAMVSGVVESLVTSLSAHLPRLAGQLLSALPDVFLLVIVTVIAGFYFCTDGTGIVRRLTALLPEGIRRRLPRWRQAAARLSWRYLRAYLLLLLLTFSLLFFGFCILRIDYAFLLALLVAVVDLLPVLGVGTVLVPWATVALLRHESFLGVGLLVLYAVILVVRQLTEPRLVGKSLGLHPLAALFATFAGWRLFGFWGMILSPFAAVLLRALLFGGKERQFENRA
jgi:sporulation integral membrane protein YtvI